MELKFVAAAKPKQVDAAVHRRQKVIVLISTES